MATHAFGNYETEYGGSDPTEKNVLDIGADYGSTASWFLARGAARVYCFERNPEMLAGLDAFCAEEPRATNLGPLRDTAHAEEVLLDLLPDIAKVDIEGGEKMLLGVSDKALSIPTDWHMETHTRDLWHAFTARFEALGYVVVVREPFASNPPERCIKVIHAGRGPG